MNQSTRVRLLVRLQAQNPHPKTELEYRNGFELLIAVILSAQATDRSVNKATKMLFALANTPVGLLKLGEAALIEHIRHIGLYRIKAKNLLKTAAILMNDYGGSIPENRVALERLPGVGRKTANVILNTLFGWPVIAVDTHIFRVANRTGLAPGKTVNAVEQRLNCVIPKVFKQNAHHWLLLHGRYSCKARNPLCEQCIISDLCENFSKKDPLSEQHL